ncbi:Type I phosphodiesterase/nucleotide pyrophosphatase/phosphate transferase [Trinorchestia longiramus]|nr:Type I phosphodiesterase/nucleotide pyrophosphatase/phosphate transferase [Trinorchestia longiramus]
MLLVGGGWKAVLLLASAMAGFVAGLLVFIQGFLLTRHALTDASACSDFGDAVEDGCWMPKKFNKTVLLLIDGLRYDFAAYDDSVGAVSTPPFLNKMPIFREILEGINSKKKNKGKPSSWRGGGFLAKFIADAPTTTMQRLKGLITGGLPTFIDLAQNFDSASIDEDNLVQQLELQGRRITVLGDDTWQSLFPTRFARNFLFPSFNVRDLDSVDSGILQHLDAQLADPQCDVIIAHFLGVDHAGHRYGPDHPSMAKKLQQMNDVVRRVSEAISDDTLLLVFGDHGMTSTGDHGGDSANEVTSAIFVYSPGLVQSSSALARASAGSIGVSSNITDNGSVLRDAASSSPWVPPVVVQQVSLVPTVSLLLGTPIPYSSVGSVVHQIFGPLADQVTALSLNVQQVHRYLAHYNREFSSNRFPVKMWERLLKVKQEIEDLESFDLVNSDHLEKYKASLEPSEAHQNQTKIRLFLLVCCGSFSNSFVVHEDAVITYALVSLLVISTLRILLVHKTKKFEGGKVVNLNSISTLLATVVLGVFLVSSAALRWSSSYRRCREEQLDCAPSTAYLPLSSVHSSLQNKRFFSGVFVLIVAVCVPRQWLSYCGNLNGMRAAIFVYRNTSMICGVLVAAYWALEAVPKPSALILYYTNFPPRIVYILALLTLSVVFIKPLHIFQLEKNKRQHYYQSNSNALIPELFNDLKAEFAKTKSSDGESETPVVYGLATALSAPVVVMVAMAVTVVLLLLGDGMGPPLLLLLLTVVGFCFLHAATCWQNPILDSVMRLRWAGPVTWCVLSLHGFYCLGHQTTFPTLPWSAAFVGHVEDGTGGMLVPALLVLVHTYSSHVLLALLLPLLPLAPLSLGAVLPRLRKKRSSDELQRGECVLVDRPEVYVASVTAFAVSYVALHAAKVLFTCVSCLFLRRHLMMWKIFAPHLMFESLGLLVTVASVIVGLCLAFRTLAALELWAIRISFLSKKPL